MGMFGMAPAPMAKPPVRAEARAPSDSVSTGEFSNEGSLKQLNDDFDSIPKAPKQPTPPKPVNPLERYEKMMKIGLSQSQITERMIADGMDPSLFEVVQSNVQRGNQGEQPIPNAGLSNPMMGSMGGSNGINNPTMGGNNGINSPMMDGNNGMINPMMGENKSSMF